MKGDVILLDEENLKNSPLWNCFIKIPTDNDSYYILRHNEADHILPNFIGYNDTCNEPEKFRILYPYSIAVGNCGTIISLSKKAIKKPYPHIYSKSINSEGYYVITDSLDLPTKRVCRLVAMAWCDRPANTNEIDHIDRNKLNDKAINLRWCTHSDNMRNVTYSKPRQWSDGAKLLLIHVKNKHQPVLVHPSKGKAITGSTNIYNCMIRQTRKTCNGWFPLLYPTFESALQALKDYNLIGTATEDKVYELLKEANISNE